MQAQGNQYQQSLFTLNALVIKPAQTVARTTIPTAKAQPVRPGTAKKVGVVAKPPMTRSASAPKTQAEPKKSIFSFGAKPKPVDAEKPAANAKPAKPLARQPLKPTTTGSKIAAASKATVKTGNRFPMGRLPAKPAAAPATPNKASSGFSLGSLFG